MTKQQQIPVVTQRKDNEARDLLPLEIWVRDVSETLSPGGIYRGRIADHSKVIDCVRQYYEEFGAIPPVRLVVRRTGLSLRRLHELFPDGYSRGVC